MPKSSNRSTRKANGLSNRHGLLNQRHQSTSFNLECYAGSSQAPSQAVFLHKSVRDHFMILFYRKLYENCWQLVLALNLCGARTHKVAGSLLSNKRCSIDCFCTQSVNLSGHALSARRFATKRRHNLSATESQCRSWKRICCCYVLREDVGYSFWGNGSAGIGC